MSIWLPSHRMETEDEAFISVKRLVTLALKRSKLSGNKWASKKVKRKKALLTSVDVGHIKYLCWLYVMMDDGTFYIILLSLQFALYYDRLLIYRILRNPRVSKMNFALRREISREHNCKNSFLHFHAKQATTLRQLVKIYYWHEVRISGDM